ncbi:hypothetical protein FRC12_017880 [Ceratobasidium sp. 428]|nr:hypothetical protein FRC12_017880 [Ceratobasidium sp. 428]
MLERRRDVLRRRLGSGHSSDPEKSDYSSDSQPVHKHRITELALELVTPDVSTRSPAPRLPPRYANQNNVMYIPIIQDCVCEFLSPHSAMAVAQTCSSLLRPAVRQLWSSSTVPIQYLLGLLPGTEISERGCFLQLKSPKKHSDMEDPDSDSFNRLNIYAPHIRHLISDTIDVDIIICEEDWHDLLWIVRNEVLLPRLISLTICGDSVLRDLLEILVRPSIKEVHMLSCEFFLLEAVSACSSLESLSLVSASYGSEPVILEQDLPLSLERLTIPAHELHTGLLARLAGMQNLQELDLVGVCDYIFLTDADSYPPGAFTALKSLVVHQSLDLEAEYMWTTPIVTNLTRLELTREFGDPTESDIAYFDIVAGACPNISSLNLAHWSDDGEPDEVSAVAILQLQSLKLNSLELRNLQVVPHLNIIPYTWPLMVTLDLHNHMTPLNNLLEIACQMSRLRRLTPFYFVAYCTMFKSDP